jgi:hypothetical protein
MPRHKEVVVLSASALVDEQFVPRSLVYYSSGYCHLFALALAAVTNAPIRAIWDLAAMDDDCEPLPVCLVHMYVVANGAFVDASGVLDVREELAIADDYECNEPDLCEHTVVDVEALIARGVLEDFLPGEFFALTAFIAANRSVYC